MSIFFPENPRHFPGQRWAKIILRALHVLAAGVYTGAWVFAVEDGIRLPWFFAALGSGLLLISIDLLETGVFLLQVRGIVVMVKLSLLFALPYLDGLEARILIGVVIASVISSHASSSFRYFLVWGRGRLKGACTKG
jgi:hypothetical protein